MELATVLIFVTGVLAGVIAGLTYIAPRTKTTADDKVLAVVLKAKTILDSLVPAPGVVVEKPKA